MTPSGIIRGLRRLTSREGRQATGPRPRWVRRPTGRGVAVLLALAGLVAACVGGLAALQTNTSPSSFLPAADESLRSLEETASSFGGDPVVALLESEKPKELLSADQLPRLLALEGKLARLPDVAVVYGPATVLNQIAKTSQIFLAELSGRRDKIRADAEAAARATGASDQAAGKAAQDAVSAFDLSYGELLVQGLPAGLPTLKNSGFVNSVAFDPDGQAKAQWRFVLPAANAAAILVRPREDLDQSATESLVAAVRDMTAQAGLVTKQVTVTGSPAVAAGLGARIQTEIPLLGGLATALIALCYLLVPWVPGRRRRLIPLAVTLSTTVLVLAAFGWLGIPVSLGVIAFLPILLGIGSDFPAYLLRGGVRRRTVIVTALASAAAFASLALSPLPFVRVLGLALAAGVLLAVATALLVRRFLPAAETDTEHEVRVQPHRSASRAVVVAGLGIAGAMAAIGWNLLPRIDVDASPERLAAGLPAIEDAAHAERLLGSSGEIDVTLAGPNVTAPEALDWMRRAEDAIVLAHGSEVRPIVTLPDLFRFLGANPTQEQIDAAMRFTPPYLTRSVVQDDRRKALLSFGVKLQDLESQRRLLDALRTTLPPTPQGYTTELVGLPVVAARGYELVSGNRYLTNAVGIVVAGLVLLVGLRRRTDAVRATAAAAMATGWGLALVAALGISLNPLTMALGSLTTATACEFTILMAGAHTGGRTMMRRTVVVAALAAGAGYATLVTSGLAVIRDFGLLLAASVALSFAAARLIAWLLPVASPDHVGPRAPGEPNNAVMV